MVHILSRGTSRHHRSVVTHRCSSPDGTTALLPVLVITCAYSRFILAVMIPTRSTADLLLGMWELLQQLGRVPRRLIWDNESGIGRGKRHAEGVGAFTGTLATTGTDPSSANGTHLASDVDPPTSCTTGRVGRSQRAVCSNRTAW